MYKTYPALFLRVKATLIDSSILALLFIVMLVLSTELGFTDPKVKFSFILLPVILIEPLMIWTTGGFLGHHYSGIRIIGKTSGKNLFILNGIVRFIAKNGFGIFSLASMLITKRHQSIHDVLSNSVVVFKDETAAAPRHKLKPRKTVYTSKKPSIGRRLIVITVYLVTAYAVVNGYAYLAVSSRCIEDSQCSNTDHLQTIFAFLVLIVTAAVVLILGLLSKLPGAYYRAKKI